MMGTRRWRQLPEVSISIFTPLRRGIFLSKTLSWKGQKHAGRL
ncbi:hypothetical protein HMPREF1862_00116 [Varibaculum cambriense]|uniref:Uncharacterized protein n=1 Tax=Varibaculum cambriense TaxID=184870 RepID=A0AB34X1X0_9ACTO|nr:hypothetical protein HMPREF1862_00116 [Varibaculum cambriense]